MTLKSTDSGIAAAEVAMKRLDAQGSFRYG